MCLFLKKLILFSPEDGDVGKERAMESDRRDRADCHSLDGFDQTVDLSGLSLKQKLIFRIRGIFAPESVPPFQSREAASSDPFASP